MKKLFLILALTFVTIFSYGQTLNFGIKAGLNISTLYFDSPNSGGNGQNLTGFNAGGIVDVGFSNFSIQPGLFYSNKGEKVTVFMPTGNQQNPTLSTAAVRRNYLELPVNFLYKVKKLINVIIQAGGGPYLGYGVSTSVTTKGKTTSVPVNQVERNPDFGVNFIAGAIFKNKYLFDAGYGLGLANLSGEGETLENRVLSFSVGYMFK